MAAIIVENEILDKPVIYKDSVICVAIIAERMLKKGKRRLIECGLKMIKIDQYTYKCECDHLRHYPLEAWEARAYSGLIQIEKSVVHQK